MSDRASIPANTNITGSVWRFVTAFAESAGRRAVPALALVALGSLLESTGVALLIPILTIVTATSREGAFQIAINEFLGTLGMSTARARLAALLGIFAAMTLASAGVLYARNMMVSDLQAGFVQNERNNLIRRLAAASWGRIIALRHARIAGLLNAEMQTVVTSASFLVQGVVAFGTLLVQIAVAFVLAPKLAVVAAVLVLASLGFLLPALRHTRTIGAEMSQARQALMNMTTGFLGALKAAAAQNLHAGFVSEFEDFQAQMYKRQRDLTRSSAYRRFTIAVVPAIVGVAVIWVGFDELGVRPAVLITIIVLFTRMTRPLVQLYQAAQQFVVGLPAFEAVRSLEAELDDRGVRPRNLPFWQSLPAGRLVLHEVEYLYSGGGGVHRATLTLEPGSIFGITGPSGSGKTTLVDLIVGILEPQSGWLSAGGQKLDDMHLPAWQNSIAYVGQDPFLFYGTVRHNLEWGGCTADDAALWRALEITGAAGLVSALEHGLETVIGDGGMRLSGGERQRIAIARALLRRPRLLVLDEATNAIDIASEAKLLERLAAFDPRPLIIVVAHRAESLLRCDQIATIERGRPIVLQSSTQVEENNGNGATLELEQ